MTASGAPRLMPAISLRPGDVAVLAAGDTRQLLWFETTLGVLVCSWSDGSQSLLDPSQPVTLLHRPGDASLPARQAPAKIEGETLGGEDATTTA